MGFHVIIKKRGVCFTPQDTKILRKDYMGFVAPVLGGIGGLMGFSGAAATVAGAATVGLGVASAVNKDVRRIALPTLGGMALGGLLAPAKGALSGSVGLGSFGGVSKSALLGAAAGGVMGMQMNSAAKARQMQEDFYNNQKAYMARQEAEVSKRNTELAKRARAAQAAQQSALAIETERNARLQSRMMRGRSRSLISNYYRDLEEGLV